MTYYRENRTAVLERARQRYHSDPVFRAKNESYKRTASARYRILKSGAKKRGYSFDLPRALFDDLTTDRCFYCGVEPSPANGVDRVDNSRGYEFGNVVSCCEQCNRAKWVFSRDEFVAWVERVQRWTSRP